MTLKILTLDIEASSGNGEDRCLIFDNANSDCVVLGAFDGLGGRSAGFDGMTGGRIASAKAVQIAKSVLKQWNAKLSQQIVVELQSKICQALKSDAESKMEKSRLSGTLTGKRLCTTIALASIPRSAGTEDNSFEISLAWMGDSRVYFLSPQKGLQQLTVDDLEIDKDAFKMIREDPRMSQYLTADIPDDWQIHFLIEKFDEKGCILVCTDGCFQYLPTPWDFERLLLETLTSTNTLDEWKDLLVQKYEQIKQDDISLVLYPLGFPNFNTLSQAYKPRLEYIMAEYNTEASSTSLDELWKIYRSDYEAKLQKDFKPVAKETLEVSASSSVENIDNKDKSDIQTNIQSERVIEREFPLDDNVANKDETATSSKGLADKADYEHANLSNVKILLEQANALFNKALRNKNASQLEEAIAKYQTVLNGDPNNLESKFFLGQGYFYLQNFQESIRYFQAVIHEKSEYYQDSLGYIAKAFYKLEDYSNSSKYFDKLKEDSLYKFFNDSQLEMYVWSLININNINRFRDALNVCDIISGRANDNVPYANYLRGVICHKWNYLNDAKKYLEESRNLYAREFKNTRSPSLQQSWKTVDAEYQKVCCKLEDQDQWRDY